MESNEKYISLPPYLSTTWRNVRSLHMKGVLLVVTLADGCAVEIPELSSIVIDKLFANHAKFLDYQGQRLSEPMRGKEAVRAFRIGEGIEPGLTPFRMGIGAFDSFGSLLQHNPGQAGSPDLPSEVLLKIASVAKIVAPDDLNNLPTPEPHCNCIHCQIARAIRTGVESHQEEPTPQLDQEDVKPEELLFREWDIATIGEKLYSVTNPLNAQEQYRVSLRNPVGCTCGQSSCEHILAVLRS